MRGETSYGILHMLNIMGIKFRKRINLGKGFGLNLSSAGLSGSYRSRMGSVGTRGFSIRTGIPGLSFYSRWKKSNNSEGGLILIVAFGLILVIIFLLVAFAGAHQNPQHFSK